MADTPNPSSRLAGLTLVVLGKAFVYIKVVGGHGYAAARGTYCSCSTKPSPQTLDLTEEFN